MAKKKKNKGDQLEKRRQQYRESRRKQRASKMKGLEFSITLGETELLVLKWISANSELKTKSSVIKELLKEAQIRAVKYKSVELHSLMTLEKDFLH